MRLLITSFVILFGLMSPSFSKTSEVEVLEKYSFPISLNQTTRATLEFALNDATDSNANKINSILDETGSELKLLKTDPEMNAMIKTTCVATKIKGGHAENALPVSASATVNCRILPQSDPNEVFKKIKELAGNKVSVSPISEAQFSPPSPITDEILKLVSSSINTSFPSLPIVPTMSTGATDAIELRSNGIPVYGTSAMMTDPTGFRAHGLDERVEISAFNASLDFWYALMEQL